MSTDRTQDTAGRPRPSVPAMSAKSAKKPAAPAVLMRAPVPSAEAERRLRPVLEALWNSNTKQALKLANQAIQKRPGWPAARALRACALLQLDRASEAADAVTDIRADLDANRVPVDEDAAVKLRMYYADLRQDDAAAEVYEQAWLADPAEFRLAETAFGLYVGANAFLHAQKLATKLHRVAAVATSKYALWSSAALWLGLRHAQPVCAAADDAPLDARMLKLVRAMVCKALGALDVPSAESARFAVRLLGTSEYETSRALISHKRLVMDPAEMLHLRAELAADADECSAAQEDYRALLEKHDADDWMHWLQYIRWAGEASGTDDDARALADALCVREKDAKHPKRGPFIAKMELLLRDGNSTGLLEAVVEHFRLFGSKMVCAHDVRPYLLSLADSKDVSAIAAALDADPGRSEDARFHVVLSWVRLWLGQLSESPEKLFRRYAAELKDGLESTDRQTGDDYLLLAAHQLLPEVNQGGEMRRYESGRAVLQAIAVLEAGLSRSPHNFHVKVLLIHLYTLVGGMDRVFSLWTSLEIKHIQLATLGHLVLPPMFEFGCHDELGFILEGVDVLWRECDKEIPEGIARAFSAGSINAALEFVLFRRRLERSAVLADAMLLHAKMELCAADGASIGVERAWAIVGRTPRFSPDTLQAPHQLAANQDAQCLSFWHPSMYRPDERLRDHGDTSTERGEPLPANDMNVLRADLETTCAILAMARMTDDRPGKDTVAQCSANAACALAAVPAALVPKRVRYFCDLCTNLNSLRSLLDTGVAAMEPKEDSNKGSSNATSAALPVSASVLLESAKASAQSLREEIGFVFGSDGSVSPQQLRECGAFVHQTLLLTSVAITSFSALLLRKPRPGKKTSTKKFRNDSGERLVTHTCAQQVLLLYKEAVLDSAEAILERLTACADSERDWVFTHSGGDCADELVPFLPDTLSPVDLDRGVVEDKTQSREEFVAAILSDIRVSHEVCCTSICAKLNSIVQRLKLSQL